MTKTWRTALMVMFLGLVGWTVGNLPFTDFLGRFSYDLPFALQSGARADEVLLVYMDDESRSRLGQPVAGPWDRALHVQLLKELTARGARAVIFDVLFDEPWKVRGIDEAFADAIRACGHVVLGASCKYTGGDGQPIVGTLITACEPLATAAPWGVAELPMDADGTIRRHFHDEVYTSLAWQAATVAGATVPNQNPDRWIRYYRPGSAIAHVSYYQLLETNSIPPGLVSNKVVFVGMAPIITYQGSRSFDEFRIPYSRWTGRNSPGVEIQATACLNLMRGDWLVRLPPTIELGLILLAALAAGLLVALLRPTRACIALGGLSLAACTAGMLLVFESHWWFNWAVISFVQAPVAAVLCGFVRTTEGSPLATSPRIPAAAVAESGKPLVPEIPDHEMLRPFGSGSYGQVWLARNILGTHRAVKIVRRDAFENAGPFNREFRGIQAFEPVSRSHEGFVHILQVGRREEEGFFYTVMELADDRVTGQSITPESYTPRTLGSDLSARGKIPCAECVEIGLQLTGALQILHAAGLVHRDIKPSNIIFVKGRPKLADIGLVAAASEAKSFVGTEGFLPPEGPGEPQADIFSLGKVLYEIAMGRDRCRYPELPTTLAEDPDCDRLLALNEVLIKACETQLTRRYRSAADLHADLLQLAAQFQARDNRPG